MGSGFVESTGTSCSGDTSHETGDFECNICFELAQDPIVSLCGHLYCWPCLYQWLQICSYTRKCPVCNAVIQQEKLVPLYGRGKRGLDPLRSRWTSGFDIPNRPAAQRPATAPAPLVNYFRQEEFGSAGGFTPMASGRFGNLSLSALLGAIQSFFNLQAHASRDASLYGAAIGAPYRYSTSFHGSYPYGSHQLSTQGQGTKYVLKICFLILGLLVILHLILS